MDVSTLHPNHRRILAALRSATRVLRQKEALTIVGGLGKYLAGEARPVGDIDVLVGAPLCGLYWEFLEVLGLHGLHPVYDLIDRPPIPWVPRRPDVGHALALTLDSPENSRAGRTPRDMNLDLCIDAPDLALIPLSARWVRWLPPSRLPPPGNPQRDIVLTRDRQEFLADLHRPQPEPEGKRLHPDLDLYFGW